jgi:hypothetical protein
MPAKAEGRPVDSVTRVTVAFPFSTIRIGDADDAATAALIAEIAGLLAAVAAELDAPRGHDVTADLAARTKALAERLAVSG